MEINSLIELIIYLMTLGYGFTEAQELCGLK